MPGWGLGADNANTEPTTETEAKISDSFLSAARTSESAGDYVSAAGYWQSLLDRDPSDVEAAVGLADNLRRLGQYGYAINVLNNALNYHPDDPRLLSLLGRALVADGNATAALDPLQRSVAIDPGVWKTQAALAVAYGMLGELARSNEANMRALAASPDNPKVLNNMGLQAAMQGDLDGAIELLERASRGDEAGSKIRLNLALLLASRGDVDEAEGLVREELSGEEAEQNIAFFRSLAGNDLQNLEELVARSNLEVEAQPAPAVGTVDSEMAAEVAATDVVTMSYDDQLDGLPAVDAGRDSDAFVLPPETVVTSSTTEETVVRRDEEVSPTAAAEIVAVAPDVAPELGPEPETQRTDIDSAVASEQEDVSILEMIGSITAPTPGAVSDGGVADGAYSNTRDHNLPVDNAFDLRYFELSEESALSSNE